MLPEEKLKSQMPSSRTSPPPRRPDVHSSPLHWKYTQLSQELFQQSGVVDITIITCLGRMVLCITVGL